MVRRTRQLSLRYLGTCGNQTADREATSMLLSGAGLNPTVIDAGPGVVRQVYRAGQYCSSIARIVITHSHGDHTAGFPYLVWSNFYDRLGGRIGPDVLEVWALDHVIDGLNQSLEFAYPGHEFPFSIAWHPIVPGERYALDDRAAMTTCLVEHAVDNIGLRLDVGSTSVAYSSDTVYTERLVELADSVDLLVHEGFAGDEHSALAERTRHATVRQAGRAAAASGAKRLELVHIFPPLQGSEALLLDEVAAEYGGPARFPADLDVVRLNA